MEKNNLKNRLSSGTRFLIFAACTFIVLIGGFMLISSFSILPIDRGVITVNLLNNSVPDSTFKNKTIIQSSFTDPETGENKRIKVFMKNNQVVKLYVDNKKVPADQYSEYSEVIENISYSKRDHLSEEELMQIEEAMRGVEEVLNDIFPEDFHAQMDMAIAGLEVEDMDEIKEAIEDCKQEFEHNHAAMHGNLNHVIRSIPHIVIPPVPHIKDIPDMDDLIENIQEIAADLSDISFNIPGARIHFSGTGTDLKEVIEENAEETQTGKSDIELEQILEELEKNQE